MINYVCGHCGRFTYDDSFDGDEVLDSGTTLTCYQCEKPTVLQLFKPAELKQLYVDAGRLNGGIGAGVK